MSIEEGKKRYAVGCYTPEDWEYIHEVLMQDGTLEDNIPNNAVKCTNIKDHSLTRAVYLLDDEEVEQLRKHSRVKYVEIDVPSYHEEFFLPPDELKMGAVRPYRYQTPVKVYRDWKTTQQIDPTPPPYSGTEINRTGYQLLRCQQKDNPWYQGSASNPYYDNWSSNIFHDRLLQYGDGTDVDVIVSDEGCWIGHVEFMSNPIPIAGSTVSSVELPVNYIGGNVLDRTAKCEVLDLVLDGPYYIDPDWFDADSLNRLETRWDGTVVPTDSAAVEWWTDSTKRSLQFSGIGTIQSGFINYTRANVCGSYLSRPQNGTSHGTQCAANAFGRTQGWAYNANKWVINSYGYNDIGVENAFDIQKIFHQYKPVNPKYGNRNPTVSSNSWGYRAVAHRLGLGITQYYFYRQGASGGTGVAFNASTSSDGTLPFFMRFIGLYGDADRIAGEMKDNSLSDAAEEMINAGVIMIAAAGNANRKQVGSAHSDYNNYFSISSGYALTESTHSFGGMTFLNTVNRRGFPGTSGKYVDPQTGQVVYPVINVGALDDIQFPSTTSDVDKIYKERIAIYSDRGEEVDLYAPGDGTVSATAQSAYNSSSYPLREDEYVIDTTYYDAGLTGLYIDNQVLPNTSSFKSIPYTSYRITTGTITQTLPQLPVVGVTTIVGIASDFRGRTGWDATINGLNVDVYNINTNAKDDGYFQLTLPFNIEYPRRDGYNSTTFTYSTNLITISSNSTIGIGNHYNDKDSGDLYTATKPPISKIMISAADNSCGQIFHVTSGTSPNRTYRVRYEGFGNSSFQGFVLSDPNGYSVVWEVVFYENTPNQIDVHIAQNSSNRNRLDSYDEAFSGTSSACPVAAGLIATKLQHNRTWTWQDVSTWINSSRVGLANTAEFYVGDESTSANDINWMDGYTIEGGDPLILWDALTGNEPYEVLNLKVGGNIKIKNAKLKFTGR